MKRSQDAFSQTFWGYLRGQALLRAPGAATLVSYGSAKSHTKHEIEGRILVDLANGKIDFQRSEDLLAFLDEFDDAWRRTPQLIDCRDPKDWRNLPRSGGHMRMEHREVDSDDYERRQLDGERDVQREG